MTGTLSDEDVGSRVILIGAGAIALNGQLLTLGDVTASIERLPPITLGAEILHVGDKTNEGTLVEAISISWFEIVKIFQRDPEAVHSFGWRQWEEIIAGAYKAQGFDEVVLTPRSGDGGRDVIATKTGVGAIRFIDQVKTHRPGGLTDADDVHAILGVLNLDTNCSKAVITTTTEFVPGIAKDERLKLFMPYRLELKPRSILIPWLNDIAERNKR